MEISEFLEFSVTQILRESDFAEFRSFKTAVFAILGAMYLVNLVYLSLKKMQKFIVIIQIQSSQIPMLKWQILRLYIRQL